MMPNAFLREIALAGREQLDAAYVARCDRKARFEPAEDLFVLRAHGHDAESTLNDFGVGTGRTRAMVATHLHEMDQRAYSSLTPRAGLRQRYFATQATLASDSRWSEDRFAVTLLLDRARPLRVFAILRDGQLSRPSSRAPSSHSCESPPEHEQGAAIALLLRVTARP
jgi:hypothetical protein